MKLKEAIETVMEAAVRDATGAGCGVRGIPTGEERRKLAKALSRTSEFVFGHPAQGRFDIGDWS